MLAVVAAGLLAAGVAGAPDTSVRVPGTALRFGMPRAQVQRLVRPLPAGAGAALAGVAPTPGVPAASGASAGPPVAVRFFGLDGQATLEFESERLARAVVRVVHPSPKDIDYVEDDLARQGYRRRCEIRDGLNRRCDFTGRAWVRLTTSDISLEAYLLPVAPAAPGSPAAGRAAPPGAAAPPQALPGAVAAALAAMHGAASPAAAAPETLLLAAPGAPPPAAGGSPDSLPAVRVSFACAAVRPDTARALGIFGRVLVEASVDSTGRVVAARIARGVPLLDAAALDCARRYRFEPAVWRGRVHPFRVVVPIAFTL